MKKGDAESTTWDLVDLFFKDVNSHTRVSLHKMCMMAYWAGYQVAAKDLQVQADKTRSWFEQEKAST